MLQKVQDAVELLLKEKDVKAYEKALNEVIQEINAKSNKVAQTPRKVGRIFKSDNPHLPQLNQDLEKACNETFAQQFVISKNESGSYRGSLLHAAYRTSQECLSITINCIANLTGDIKVKDGDKDVQKPIADYVLGFLVNRYDSNQESILAILDTHHPHVGLLLKNAKLKGTTVAGEDNAAKVLHNAIEGNNLHVVTAILASINQWPASGQRHRIHEVMTSPIKGKTAQLLAATASPEINKALEEAARGILPMPAPNFDETIINGDSPMGRKNKNGKGNNPVCVLKSEAVNGTPPHAMNGKAAQDTSSSIDTTPAAAAAAPASSPVVPIIMQSLEEAASSSTSSADVTKLQAQIQDLIAKCAELEGALQTSMHTISVNDSEKSHLQNGLSALQTKHYEEIALARKAREDEIQTLQADLNAIQERLQKTNAQLLEQGIKANEDYTSLEKQKKELEERITKLNAELAQEKQTSESQAKVLQEAQTTLAELNKALQKLSKDETTKALSDRLNKLTASIDAWKNKFIEGTQNKVKELEAAIKTTQENVAQLHDYSTGNFKELNDRLTEGTDRWKDSFVNTEGDVRNLKTKLDRLEATTSNFATSTNHINSTPNDSTMKELLDGLTVLSAHTTQLEALQKQLAELSNLKSNSPLKQILKANPKLIGTAFIFFALNSTYGAALVNSSIVSCGFGYVTSLPGITEVMPYITTGLGTVAHYTGLDIAVVNMTVISLGAAAIFAGTYLFTEHYGVAIKDQSKKLAHRAYDFSKNHPVWTAVALSATATPAVLALYGPSIMAPGTILSSVTYPFATELMATASSYVGVRVLEGAIITGVAVALAAGLTFAGCELVKRYNNQPEPAKS